MGCSNYGNLSVPEKNDNKLFDEYWTEYLLCSILTHTSDLDLEVPNEVLLKNYDFYKLCHEFFWDINSLTYYLNDEGYRSIVVVNETNFKAFLRYNPILLINWTYNFYSEDWLYIMAIKCNPEKIEEVSDKYRLHVDIIANG